MLFWMRMPTTSKQASMYIHSKFCLSLIVQIALERPRHDRGF